MSRSEILAAIEELRTSIHIRQTSIDAYSQTTNQFVHQITTSIDYFTAKLHHPHSSGFAPHTSPSPPRPNPPPLSSISFVSPDPPPDSPPPPVTLTPPPPLFSPSPPPNNSALPEEFPPLHDETPSILPRYEHQWPLKPSSIPSVAVTYPPPPSMFQPPLPQTPPPPIPPPPTDPPPDLSPPTAATPPIFPPPTLFLPNPPHITSPLLPRPNHQPQSTAPLLTTLQPPSPQPSSPSSTNTFTLPEFHPLHAQVPPQTAQNSPRHDHSPQFIHSSLPIKSGLLFPDSSSLQSWHLPPETEPHRQTEQFLPNSPPNISPIPLLHSLPEPPSLPRLHPPPPLTLPSPPPPPIFPLKNLNFLSSASLVPDTPVSAIGNEKDQILGTYIWPNYAYERPNLVFILEPNTYDPTCVISAAQCYQILKFDIGPKISVGEPMLFTNFLAFKSAVEMHVVVGHTVLLCGEPPPEIPLGSFWQLTNSGTTRFNY